MRFRVLLMLMVAAVTMPLQWCHLYLEMIKVPLLSVGDIGARLRLQILLVLLISISIRLSTQAHATSGPSVSSSLPSEFSAYAVRRAPRMLREHQRPKKAVKPTRSLSQVRLSLSTLMIAVQKPITAIGSQKYAP